MILKALTILQSLVLMQEQEDDSFRLLLRNVLAHIAYFAVCNAQICTKQHIHFLIHGHHGDIGDQSIQTNTSFLLRNAKCKVKVLLRNIF